MPEFRVVASAERWCAAPREAILGFERDPLNAPIIEPRLRVSDVQITPDLVGTSWTAVVTTGKIFHAKFRAILMGLDPVIIESRRQKQVQTATARVSKSADDQGRYLLTYTAEAVFTVLWTDAWIYRLMLGRMERTSRRDIELQIDRGVAAIEAGVGAR